MLVSPYTPLLYSKRGIQFFLFLIQTVLVSSLELSRRSGSNVEGRPGLVDAWGKLKI